MKLKKLFRNETRNGQNNVQINRQKKEVDLLLTAKRNKGNKHSARGK